MTFKFRFPGMDKIHFLSIILLFASFLSLTKSIALMSIDLGSEWMKIAVVAPGKPMEIVLNMESKRKTPICLSFRDGVRAFGEEACTVGVRFPKMNHVFLLDLLGKKVDSPIVKLYKKRFPYYEIEPEPNRGTVMFKYDRNTSYTVEELLAQIIDHARILAQNHAEENSIKDAVITVPPFFNQAEKRAILDAAEIAGLKVLTLIHDSTAVSLNYGMFRRSEITDKIKNILFYDMGSYSTTATVSSYETVKTKEKGYSETNPQVTIRGVGYDRSLGGLEIQMKLRDHLASEFEKQTKVSGIWDSPRAMTKLLRAADKLRTVLSANNQHRVHIESLYAEKDFSLSMDRETFEKINQEIFDRVTRPIDQALIAATLDVKDIDQVIIVGGSTRIPRVKKILTDHLKMDLGMSINADEASALGAVYKAADLGTGFKVKTFHIKESNMYPIEVSFEREFEREDGTLGSKSVKRVLFTSKDPCPQKKVMTFNKHSTDFGFSVNYELSDLHNDAKANFDSSKIAYVMVQGVTDVYSKYADSNDTVAKGIKAHFYLNEACVLNITSVEAVFEQNKTASSDGQDKAAEDDSILSKISKLVTGTDEQNEKPSADSSKSEKSEENAPSSDNAKSNKTSTKTSSKKDAVTTLKIDLEFKINYLDLKPMSPDAIEASVKKLSDIDEMEKTRKKTEMARNSLESMIVEVQDKMEQEKYVMAAKAQEKTDIEAKALEFRDWLEIEEENSIASYEERFAVLNELFRPIKSRVWEAEERPKILKELKDLLNSSNVFVKGLTEAAQNEKHLASVDVTNLEQQINYTEKWIEEMEEKQASSSPSEDPPLTVEKISKKWAELNREVQAVIQRVKIAKAKKEREEAEALKKAAVEKAKAEKEAKEKLKENVTDSEKVIPDPQKIDPEDQPATASPEDEAKQKTDEEAVPSGDEKDKTESKPNEKETKPEHPEL